MKLVFVTQTLDPDHPALAQTLDLVRVLSGTWDEVAVVTREHRWAETPANVEVRTFDSPTRAGRVTAFERALVPSVRGAHAVFVHMVPEFLLLAAPVARLRRLPLLLWYTHWNAGRALRIATRLADVVLSVDRASFPLATPKLRPIGHAIDTSLFTAGLPDFHDGPTRWLALGRTARWKGLETLLDATEIALAGDVDLEVEIRGPSLTDDEVAHRSELEERIRSGPLRGRVRVLPAVPRSDVPALLGSVDAIVSPNQPRSGSTFDKAVFEAAACARPVVSTNAEFAPLLSDLPLPLLAPPHDAAALADVMRSVTIATVAERAATGEALRARVVEQHSLEHWAAAVSDVIREVRSSRE
jgi:glycosyltransferase involved in cell wall biosynthesis